MNKRLDIQSTTIRQFAYDLALLLDVELIENSYEFLCPIPVTLGSGYFKVYQFENGIAAIETSAIFLESFTYSYCIESVYLTNILLNLNSAFDYLTRASEIIRIKRFDSIIHGDFDNVIATTFPKNVPISTFTLLIQGDLFLKKVGNFENDNRQEWIEFIHAIHHHKKIFSIGSYTLDINKLIANFQANTYMGPMRFIYQEAKASEIVYERIRQYIDDKQEKKPTLLRKSTIDSIEAAALWISNNLDVKKTVVELAKDVGLSANTLQNGFKYQFGCSVNEFIVSAKLKKAIELLERGELNISEITYELGISSKSYFAKLFSERYGITPSEYRKLNRVHFRHKDSKIN